MNAFGSLRRIRWLYAGILGVASLFIVRAFYLQVIQHDYYEKLALTTQLKQYTIPASRGLIEAQEGSQAVPLVLNQTLYEVVADPTIVQNPAQTATAIQKVIGGDESQYEKSVSIKDTRYSIVAKKISEQQKDQLASLKLRGIYLEETDYRTYPEGDLASQLLGFVNNDGQGTYGIEQYFNNQLKGTPGQLKAITDVNGVPLAANKDNIETQPVAGKNVVLTVDIAMQQQLENILQAGLKADKSTSGSALIMDTNTGHIKAMANFPTYDPSQYYNVTDSSVFNNAAVSSPLEVGSIMKTLTVSAALDSGAIMPNETYYDPSHFTVDGFTITNIEQDGGPQTRSITDILTYSLNTGATWMLMQMGGGQINDKARATWNDYMVNHFQLGKPTGIEQGYESPGYIPDPNKGYARDLTYANTAFGQAMTATPLQMGAAVSSVLNGGTYYQPTLVDRLVDANGNVEQNQPKVVRKNVVSPTVSQDLINIMQQVVDANVGAHAFPAEYLVGGKTGTAQIAAPNGGYLPDDFNGTYVGFVGGDKPEYVIVVRVNDPHVNGYAGHDAAQPIFVKLTDMLINNFGVTPKSN